MNENDFDEGLQTIFVCTSGEDCLRAQKQWGLPDGAEANYNAIKKLRNEQGLKRQVYVVRTSCQGWCQYAPVCSVMPRGEVFGHVNPDLAAQVLKQAQNEKGGLEQNKIYDFRKNKEQNLLDKQKRDRDSRFA